MSKCWCGGDSALDINSNSVCMDSEFHDPFADGRPKSIRTVYISGPMSGYKDNNYPAFNSAAQVLREVYGFTVVNPAEFGGGEKRVHYTDLLRQDLKALLDCDAVATLPMWWESQGARHEVATAGLLKMPVRSVPEWIETYGSRTV